MVDVKGIEQFSFRLTEKCNCTSEQIANAEFCARESLAKILLYENVQFQSIFNKYKTIKFFPSSTNENHAIDSRETLGVSTVFLGYELFTCPVLVGGKMYKLIVSGLKMIDEKIWNESLWTPPECLFCKTDLVPTCIIVKGRPYTLGLLIWTNYQKVLFMKKHKGFIMYSNTNGASPMTAAEFPILNDFSSMQETFPTSIGNRKLFHGGYVFTEMVKQTLVDIEKMRQIEKRDILIKQLIRAQNKRINTGCIDWVIGRNTAFNLPENETSSTVSKSYSINNIGRYKVLHKLDFTAISKCLQIDVLTTQFSRRIPKDLQRGDVGYVCLISNSENTPGVSGLELVLGCMVSTPSDCSSVELIESFLRLHFELLPISSPQDCDLNSNDWWYVIINQSLFKHVKEAMHISDWVVFLRTCVKNILAPCIEVYQVSERLYAIYSLPLTVYKPFHDGLAYSSMEVSTTDDLFVNIIAENYNLHGITAMLIPNLNSNHLIRNTMAAHAIKNCVSGVSSHFLKNESYLLNKFQLFPGVPFYCIKANILLFPLAHNIEDACAISAKSADEKKLFTICKNLTSTVHLERPTILKKLIKQFPTTLKPHMILLKFKAEKTFHVGKHLTIKPDIFERDVNNVVWTPNMDVIRQEHYLNHFKISRDNSGNVYCDFGVSYLQDGDLGLKLFLLNGTQKTVVGSKISEEEMPRLHNTVSIEDVAHIDIDIVQHPFSLKRLSMNFLSTPELSPVYNECFSVSAIDRLTVLKGKQDYFVSNRKTDKFYVDNEGCPTKVIVYQGFVLPMAKQNPYGFLHCASIDRTPVNIVTGQPEVRYQTSNFCNSNSHPFGLSDSEREICVGVGLNSFLEEIYDKSDENHLSLENNAGQQVCIPFSKSAARVLDMLSLADIEVDFLVKNMETEF